MLHATGTQDLNKMGGLMKFMPLTAVTALVASFSISGVPLFNGFVSKWSIYVAAVQGSGSARYLAVCAVIAILTSALTLASFIKFFGVSFLSRTSALVTARAAAARPARSRLDDAGAAGLAGAAVRAAGRRAGHWLPPDATGVGCQPPGLRNRAGQGRPDANRALGGRGEFQSTALFAPLALALVLGLMFLVVRVLSKLGGASRRAAAPWLCGYVREADCHRYFAHNFYGEIKRYFRWLGGAPRPQREEPSAKP